MKMLAPFFRASLLAAAGLAQAAAPTWRHELPGPDWIPPNDFLVGGLEVSEQGASLLVVDHPDLWLLATNAAATDLQRTRTAGTVGGSHGRLVATTPGLLLARTTSGPEFQIGCLLQRRNPNLSVRWEWSIAPSGVNHRTCELAFQLRSGAVVSSDYEAVFALDDAGQPLWRQSHGEVGTFAQRIVQTGSGRLLAVGTGLCGGQQCLAAALLDPAGGQRLELHLGVPEAELEVLAARVQADGGVEVLARAGAGSQPGLRLARYDALGVPLSYHQLDGYDRQPVAALPHAGGFVLHGWRDGVEEVRWYDGAQLRWRRAAEGAPPLFAPMPLASSAQGEVALVRAGAVQRIDAAGQPLPLAVLAQDTPQAMQLRYDPRGRLWVHHRAPSVGEHREMRLSRFAAGGGAAQAALRLALPARGAGLPLFEAQDDGSVGYVASLYSSAALERRGRLLAGRVSASGQASTNLDLLLQFDQAPQVYELQPGWVVLAAAESNGPKLLQAVTRAGRVLWQRSVGELASLACDRVRRCALQDQTIGAVGPLQLLDFDGSVLASQDQQFELLTSDDRRGLRGIRREHGVRTYWSLDALPARRLARAAAPDLGYFQDLPVLGERLLGLWPDRLALHGDDQVLWSQPHAGQIVLVGARNGRLHVVERDPLVAGTRIRQLDPVSGQTLRSTLLPQHGVVTAPGLFSIRARIEARSDQVDWVQSGDGEFGRNVLLALRPGLPPLEFGDAPNVRDFRALPGSAAVVHEAHWQDREPRTFLAHYELELFRDGFE